MRTSGKRHRRYSSRHYGLVKLRILSSLRVQNARYPIEIREAFFEVGKKRGRSQPVRALRGFVTSNKASRPRDPLFSPSLKRCQIHGTMLHPHGLGSVQLGWPPVHYQHALNSLVPNANFLCTITSRRSISRNRAPRPCAEEARADTPLGESAGMAQSRIGRCFGMASELRPIGNTRTRGSRQTGISNFFTTS